MSNFAPLCSVLCIVRESLSIILYQTYSIYILAFLSIFWLKKLVLFEIFPFYLICPTVCDSLSMAERSKFCWDQRLEHSHNLLVNSKQLKTFRYYLFIKTFRSEGTVKFFFVHFGLKDKEKKYSAYKHQLRGLYFGLNYNNWIYLFSQPLLVGDWQMIWNQRGA